MNETLKGQFKEVACIIVGVTMAVCFVPLICVIAVKCTAKNYTYIEQTGIVVDVEYHGEHNTVYTVPGQLYSKRTRLRARRAQHLEKWTAHIHYCDTICVHETYDKPIYQGDTVKRNIRIKKIHE